jgi:hypothetical protein
MFSFTLPQKGVDIMIKAQVKVGLFLWLQRDSVSTICYTWSNCQPDALSPGCFNISGSMFNM